jgi:hypothetical protein
MTRLAVALLLVTLAAVTDATAQNVVAVVATGTQDGVVNVPSNGYTAFSITAVNLGPTNYLSVSAGDALVCTTDPATAGCGSSPPSISPAFLFNAGTVRTFSVFPHGILGSGIVNTEAAEDAIPVVFRREPFGLLQGVPTGIQGQVYVPARLVP